jgi:hypothetical protein
MKIIVIADFGPAFVYNKTAVFDNIGIFSGSVKYKAEVAI